MADESFEGFLDQPVSSPEKAGRRPLCISEFTTQVQQLLESGFPRVWVEGEISNWTLAGSGHAYFALKDEGALLNCVMWRSAVQRSPGAFRDGDHVEARGKLSVYQPRGAYQLVVQSLKPVGEGLLWQKFLELKAKLEAEGLFDPAVKRAIPKLPRSVGVVTSPTGAAIQDILDVIGRRAPGVQVLIWPARVQGAGSAKEITAGVKRLGESGLVDVLIVGRGGGSLEDLWEFNDEALARAIRRCAVPVISAVGHEVDFTICDFVSDQRAPTPSAAAELVSAEHGQQVDRLREIRQRIDLALSQRMRDFRSRLSHALDSYSLREPETRLREAQQRLDETVRRLDSACDGLLREDSHRVRSAMAALQGHNPQLILQKGYAIVRRAKNGKVLMSAEEARKARQLRTQFRDGAVRSNIMEDVPDLFE